MPTNEQRRAAAKRKLARQMERKAAQARRRKRLVGITAAAVVVIVLVVVGVVLWSKHEKAVAAEHDADVKANTCAYTKTPQQAAPKGKDVGLPPNPYPVNRKGTVKVTLQTGQGPIGLTLDRAQAACTVQSFVHLAQKKFFDNTPCHRETTTEGLKVLQCGDPTGTGEGGPGYTIPDEKPTKLKPAPQQIQQQYQQAYQQEAQQAEQQGQQPPPETLPDTYPRGTIAMANSGQPNSGGSQFFLVYGDSYLPPDYTVFGTIDAAGLSTVDKIIKAGLIPGKDPNSGQTSPTDGKPKQPVTIKVATVSG